MSTPNPPLSDPAYPLTNITHPGPNDILCGRGGGTNAHPGNVKFRKLVATHKLRYLAASKSDKPAVARDVVKEWRAMDPPGRFLAKMEVGEDGMPVVGGGRDRDNENDDEDDCKTNQNDNHGNSNNSNNNNNNNHNNNNNNGGSSGNTTTLWYDVGDKKAREKASQCLRERNGAANEAVAALVKTVTANGEACPQDYTTLVDRAKKVAEEYEERQNQLAMMQTLGGMGGHGMGNMGMNNMGMAMNNRGMNNMGMNDNFNGMGNMNNLNSMGGRGGGGYDNMRGGGRHNDNMGGNIKLDGFDDFQGMDSMGMRGGGGSRVSGRRGGNDNGIGMMSGGNQFDQNDLMMNQQQLMDDMHQYGNEMMGSGGNNHGRSRGNDRQGGMNNMGMAAGNGNFNNINDDMTETMNAALAMGLCQETFEPIPLPATSGRNNRDRPFGNNHNINMGNMNNVGGGRNNNYNDMYNMNDEDDLIEAEIQRLLKQQQQQMMRRQMGMQDGGMSNMAGNRGYDDINIKNDDLDNLNNNNLNRIRNSANTNNLSKSLNHGGGRGPKRSSLPDIGFSSGPAPYLGEETVLREYQKLVQQQQQQESTRQERNNRMSMPLPNKNSGRGMNQNSDDDLNTEWLINMVNKRSTLPANFTSKNSSGSGGYGQGNINGNGNMMYSPSMGGGDNGSNNSGGGGGYDDRHQDRNNQGTPDPDAAQNYLNRLRMLRQEGGNSGGYDGGSGGGGNNSVNNSNVNINNNMPETALSSHSARASGGMKNGMSGILSRRGMGDNEDINIGPQDGGGGSRRRGNAKSEEFNIEEYQASLQEFLSHDDEYAVPSRSGGSDRGKSSNSKRSGNPSGIDNNGTIGCFEVPTSIGDKNGGGDRQSIRTLNTLDIARGTFKSVDTGDRQSFRSVDDLDVRPSFRSVDTMDLMSIGNSINEIMEEDMKQNPENRKKYSRRLSESGRVSRSGGNYSNNNSINDFAYFPGTTLEVKTMSHGQGGGGGPKKIRKAIDPRLATLSGVARGSMQDKDGKPRGSLLSFMSRDLTDLDNVLDDGTRMSFGNISVMSELSDFGDLLPGIAAGSKEVDDL
ncbi:hypothetical protein ACHAXS_008458 [Conticribra weissflogii]